ncbi:MAG TPA: ABC transporter permease [Rhodopila sp.]|uniref:ABC transporter permease n=1 Tax=Rhodopila sp. TaxID=2480087 RepID=UPI002CC637D0|nr:ABC transporter permease [Rhodopila sp.]HVY13729.1 ABC transporter permease [Rhodopila sp.]
MSATRSVAAPPAALPRLSWLAPLGRALPMILWGAASIGLFAGIWEVLWAIGWADPKLLPPPHIFIGSIADQAKFFNTVSRWQIGSAQADVPSPAMAVLYTILSTTGRVFAGLVVASVLAISIGIGIRYFRVFGKLTLPTVTLLAPVSPIAWLPVAIFLFGIGNGPAIFMVVIALLFHMVLATIHQIDSVNRNLINVARTMGASKRQTYARVIIPAILPQLFVVLRFNLFAAWMVVLVAEATGVGYGLGQVIMLARNTFNPSLVFFTIFLIGILGYLFDLGMRLLQRKLLYWVPQGAEVLRGL